MTWEEIKEAYDTDQDDNFENDDWSEALDVHGDNWRGHGEVAKLSNDELMKAMKDAAGCGCCASSTGSTLGDSIWAEITRRIRR
jgi:hypothetical protein